MNIDRKILYTLVYSLFGLLSLTLLISISFTRYITAILLVIFTILVYVFIKKRNVVSIHTRDIIYLMLVISLVYLMIYYLSGIKFGFHESLYPFSFQILLKYVFPSAVIIICSEFIRYVFLAQNNNHTKIISFISCALIDFLMVYNIFSIKSLNIFMDAIGIVIFPSIMSNILFHYLSENFGFLPNVIFRLITNLYIYIIPFIPSTPDSLIALFKLLIPLLILWFIKLLYQKKVKYAREKQSKVGIVMFSFLVVLIISFIMLITNKFKFGAIVIATDSMKNEISSGDVIIYERIDSDDNLSIGQVIVFTKNDSLIVHRIDDIKFIDGELRYYTKGDNNLIRDTGYITRSDIVGYTDLKIPYVGYPTLWLYEFFERPI